jgi:transposase
MRRCIGLDVHREFAQVAIWEDGVVRQAGRIELTPQALREFAASLCASDQVAIEATGNTHAIARLLERHVGRVVVSNPQKTRAIAEAKVKTDKVDAAVLAGLLAADYLPAVWLPDEATFALRRQVARRAHIVRQRTRLKNQVQSILHRNLVPRCRPPTCSATRAGRGWPPRTCPKTSTRQSRRCCASSTSTPQSCRLWTPSSAGSRWSAPRSGGC